jgi:hypothetical protein
MAMAAMRATATMKAASAMNAAATAVETTVASSMAIIAMVVASMTVTVVAAVIGAEPYEWPVTVISGAVITAAVIRIVIRTMGIAVEIVARGIRSRRVAWADTYTESHLCGRWRCQCPSSTGTNQESQCDF